MLLRLILGEEGEWDAREGEGVGGGCCALWQDRRWWRGNSEHEGKHEESRVSVGEVCDEQDKDVPRATATATAKMQNSD